MTLDHLAIRKAYPAIVILDDSFVDYGLDKDGNKVYITQSNVDAARIELNKLNYQTDRTIDGSTTYSSFGDQLDMLYHDIVAGKLDTTGTWATHIKEVKDANPKP
jgi:hypothetical protein